MHIIFKSNVATLFFNCKNCTKKLKYKYGCYRDKKKDIVWVHEECPYCFGKLKKCQFCKGLNEITFYRCVHKSATDFKILDYFFEYRKYCKYPDGRGRYYQPVKLLLSFRILENLFIYFENKDKK